MCLVYVTHSPAFVKCGVARLLGNGFITRMRESKQRVNTVNGEEMSFLYFIKKTFTKKKIQPYSPCNCLQHTHSHSVTVIDGQMELEFIFCCAVYLKQQHITYPALLSVCVCNYYDMIIICGGPES